MKIDIEKLDDLVKKSNKIFITPEGEEVLLQLLALQEQVEAAIDEAEKRLEESALKLDPNFTSLQANRIKVYYRAYGSKYKIDESRINDIPKELYTLSVRYSANTKEIEKYSDEHKGLPLGIVEADRTKSLKFSEKNKIKNEE